MTVKVVDVGQQYAGATVHGTQGGYPVHLTASGQIFAGPGILIGFFVNATSAGTIQICDALTNTNAISGVITPAAGQFCWFPSIHLVGIFAQIAGTSLDITAFYQK
jgi:hypothetical protein